MTGNRPLTPQAGILNRPPEHYLGAALEITSADPASAASTLEDLRQLLRSALRSNLDDQGATTPKDQPSPETGELGFRDGYDRQHLTVTVGFGLGAFEKLGTPPDNRPQDLTRINWEQLGDGPEVPEQGDLLVQVCSDDPYINEHVLRHIESDLGSKLRTTWVMNGVQRYSTREGRTARHEGRALNGFIDGTSNLDPAKDAADRDLVFINPDAVPGYPQLPSSNNDPYSGRQVSFPPDLRPPPSREPEWTRNGTYMTVRGSTLRTSDWDQAALGQQEQTIGRFKYSGAFLDLDDEVDQLESEPAFVANPADERVPLTSHARKSNPRRPEDLPRRLFRRGYPLIDSASGQLRRGLIFVSFARTISTQFEFMVRAWMRNPDFPALGSGPDQIYAFEEAVIAGGYYFVPGLSKPNQPWTWVVPA